jgi:hypothetical protein
VKNFRTGLGNHESFSLQSKQPTVTFTCLSHWQSLYDRNLKWMMNSGRVFRTGHMVRLCFCMLPTSVPCHSDIYAVFCNNNKETCVNFEPSLIKPGTVILTCFTQLRTRWQMYVNVNLHLSALSCLLVVFSASLSTQCHLFYQRHWKKKTVVHNIWYIRNTLSRSRKNSSSKTVKMHSNMHFN